MTNCDGARRHVGLDRSWWWLRCSSGELDTRILLWRKAIHVLAAVEAWPLVVLPTHVVAWICIVVCLGTFVTQRRVPYASLAVVTLLPFVPSIAIGGAWVVFAVGDGFASPIGRAWGRRRFPGSRTKTWLGTIAFATTSMIALAIYLLVVGRSATDAIEVGALVSAAAAVTEAMVIWVDDDYAVTVVAGIALAVCLR